MNGRLLLLAFLVPASLAAGCSPRKMLVPDLPPETVLFVQGPVDTVNHVARLYWFGTDPDGEVTGFEIRFRNPASPADTQWAFTTRTDSLFTVFTPTGFTLPTFEARAVDDDGLRDPTPARQDFAFSNEAPTVTLINPPVPADSTFASLTLFWTAEDRDGNASRLQFRVWLDGNEPNARLVSGRSYTFPADDFRQAGQLLDGYRTAFVQPIDDGGRAGTPASVRWYVRAPVSGARARLLIVDDLPSSDGNNMMFDTLFVNTASRNLAAGEYSVLRLQFSQPFRSAKDVEQTFRLFESVMWYRGGQLSFSAVMRDFQDGIGAYLEAGGRLYLEGLHLVRGRGVNSDGALGEDFVTRYLGSSGLFRNLVPGQPDSSASWGIGNNDTLRSVVYGDSLRFNGIFDGVRGFAVREPGYVALYAPAGFPYGTLNPVHGFDIPIAVTVPQPSGGRAIAMTIPLARANRTFVTGGSTNTARVLAKIFQQLGLAP